MKVFLSWSGENSQSHQVAEALKDWLPNVIQQVNPWLSSQDIKTGSKWQTELNKQLADTRFGIFSITQESKDKPYLLFEAGALSRYVDDESYVCPYYFGLKPTDVKNPISEYQGSESTEEGTLKLLESMNSALLNNQLPSDKLKMAFNRWWPDLESNLERIAVEAENFKNKNEEPVRNEREILEEILSLTRKMSHEKQRPKPVEKLQEPPGSETLENNLKIFDETIREKRIERDLYRSQGDNQSADRLNKYIQTLKVEKEVALGLTRSRKILLSSS